MPLALPRSSGPTAHLSTDGPRAGGDNRPVDLLNDPDVPCARVREALTQHGHDRLSALIERNDEGQTLLLRAAMLGRDDLVDLILNVVPPGRSAQALIGDAQGMTPLMLAVCAGARAVVQRLLPVSDPNARSVDGVTALMLAAEQPDEPLLLRVLGRSLASLNALDARGRSALMRAAERGQALAVAALMDVGADDTLRTPDGQAHALHLAAAGGQAESVALLARSRDRLLERTLRGANALDLALKNHHLAAAAVLIARMPNDVVRDSLNRAVTDHPGVYGTLDGLLPVDHLLAPSLVWGSDRALDLRDVRLRCAAQAGDLLRVCALLDEGADPNRGDTGRHGQGMGPLTLACLGQAGDAAQRQAPGAVRAVVQRLLAAGADPNGAPGTRSPVLAACQSPRWDVVIDLLQAGARPTTHPDAPTNVEEEPLARQRLPLLHRFLLHAPQRFRVTTPTLPAMGPSALDVVRALVRAGADVRATHDAPQQQRFGTTALLLVAEGWPDLLAAPLMDVLLDAGADPNRCATWSPPALQGWNDPGSPNADARAEHRWTALAAAANLGKVETCRALVLRGAHLNHRLDQNDPPTETTNRRSVTIARSALPAGPSDLAHAQGRQGVSVLELLHRRGWSNVAAHLENLVLRREVANLVPGVSGAPRPRL